MRKDGKQNHEKRVGAKALLFLFWLRVFTVQNLIYANLIYKVLQSNKHSLVWAVAHGIVHVSDLSYIVFIGGEHFLQSLIHIHS